jgi:nucleotide-binding universal stress UspA family protein
MNAERQVKNMKLVETIVIATDGSDRNRAAVDEGLKIARACGSQVWAIYVIDTSVFAPVQYGSAMAGPGNTEVNRELDDEAQQVVGRIRDLAGELQVGMVIREGKPAAEIIRFAAENKAGLIVIGSRGKGGLERLLLGSVADEVVRTAPCSVLVVK